MKSGCRINIFTECGKKIGFGHISRCTALYDEAKRQGLSVELYIQKSDDDVTDNCILGDRIYNIVNWQSVEYLQNNLNSNDYCIIDSYLATVEVYEKIAQCSAKALYIDDYGRLDYPKGIIVNPSLSTEGIHYPQKSDREYLLGHEYIILRSRFIGKKKIRYSKSVNRVLITLGGTDILNLTGRIVSFLVPLFPEISFDIVSLKGLQDLKEWCQFDNIHFYNNLNDKGMCELMLKSDFAITAAGQTIHELIALRLPFFVIQTAENQRNNIKILKRILDKNYLSTINEEHLCEKIVIGLNNFCKRPHKFNIQDLTGYSIDGLGCKRIIEKLFSVKETIILKKANMSDCDLLFKWANDETVRVHAFNSQAIGINDHIFWLANKIKESSAYIYIAFFNDIPIGQIRVDEKNMDSGEISYSIDKDYRGKGYGKMMVENLIMLYTKNESHGIRKLTGKVKCDNIASQKVFENLGFEKSMMNNYLLYTMFLNKK